MEKCELSEAMRWLIERCQEINFGRITVVVCDGEPDRSQPLRIVRAVKAAGGENGPRAEMAMANFQLRKEQIELVRQLAGADDGDSVEIEVKHGLPFLIEIEQVASGSVR